MYSITVDTQGAAEELSTASEYQRKAGRRAACLINILVVVIAVVLLAVRLHAQCRKLTRLADPDPDLVIELRCCAPVHTSHAFSCFPLRTNREPNTSGTRFTKSSYLFLSSMFIFDINALDADTSVSALVRN